MLESQLADEKYDRKAFDVNRVLKFNHMRSCLLETVSNLDWRGVGPSLYPRDTLVLLQNPKLYSDTIFSP